METSKSSNKIACIYSNTVIIFITFKIKCVRFSALIFNFFLGIAITSLQNFVR